MSAVLFKLALISALVCSVVGTERVITFRNKCSADVWLNPTTGAAGLCTAGCPAGTKCDTNNNICFYETPTPTNGNWRVKAGDSNSIVFPLYSNNLASFWDGNFDFCMAGTSCTASSSECDAQGCGSTGPLNLFEINMVKTNVDFYDISNIAGVNVPASVTPSHPVYNGDPWSCGSPGSETPNTGMGPSSWQESPPSYEYQWVTNTGAACSSNSQCASGQVCGLELSGGTFSNKCGTLSGYWTPSKVCTEEAGTSFFNCGTALTNGNYHSTVGWMYQCNGATSGSCYQNGADQYCCGCANWNEIFGSAVVPDSVVQCKNTDSQWTKIVLPTIQWLKKSCPSCYTYPYDDMSSTFTCAYTEGGYNVQNYTVTLCPTGSSTTSSSSSSGSGSSSSSSSGSSSSGSSSGESTSGCPTGEYYCPNINQCYSPSKYVCSSTKPYLCPTSAPHFCNGGCSSTSC